MTKTNGGFFGSWPVLLVGGQVIWIAHFLVVYLWAEAACARLSDSSVRMVTLSATIVAVIAIVSVTRQAWNMRRRPMMRVGLLLSCLALVATLFVGLPVLFLDPC